MSAIAKPERATQKRVIALFRDALGYQYLGDWSERQGNSNIEDGLLTAFLAESGYSPAHTSRALYALHREASHASRSLYDNNQAVYRLLRYGVPVKAEVGQVTETVHLIDWKAPHQNHFAIAEEVTLKGPLERRPDLVLYVNGIAIGVIELKNSRTSIGDGIRQNLSNQLPEFNAWFFTTVQFVFAGSDSEGLKYGTIGTPEKFFLQWKEDEADNSGYKLDKYLRKMCAPARMLELVHDFVLFDGGYKKLPRVHQYFGTKAAQRHVAERKGGIVWHTQGSGKSIVMVLLAQWILENLPHARVAIVTDRDELDKQIVRVLRDAGLVSSDDADHKVRATSGRDLMAKLAQPTPRLLCSLVHKFGQRGVDDFEAYIKELQAQPSPTVGELFVFVDECHRTQSGKLHRVMKALMPGAVFIGFTGTPLLKEDQQTTQEVFGGYIHTYKFSEGVQDGVVLDLVYEARDIEQRLTSQQSVDEWFALVSKDLNDWQREELKAQWGTMQNVLSSAGRMRKVVQDIVLDFRKRPRLSSERGNAILVASSIYEACKYFMLFQSTPLKGKCAVITSYNPNAQDVTKEETGANTETDKQFLYNTYTELLKNVGARPGMGKTETYEDDAKNLFIKQPARMKLLVVVQKLLTGFDAPPCTYLYIDKSMQDHGLFQAICRTNRLDAEDKDFGYIVDYKDLFKKLVNDKGTGALQVYTSELDDSAGGATPEVLVQDRLEKGRERLDNVLEVLALLCEPVAPPSVQPDRALAHIHYFCGNTDVEADLKEREPQRVALYKATVALVRAYAGIADELLPTGYSQNDVLDIKQKLKDYVNLREIIRKASGETLDLKAYEADMRHLIDTYIEASTPKKISPFDNMGLLELIARSGMDMALASLPEGLRKSPKAAAEAIENNVRSKINREHLNDPNFYATMSALLDEIIQFRKQKASDYAAYLQKIADLARLVETGHTNDTPAPLKNSPALRALYSNLQPLCEITTGVHKVSDTAAIYLPSTGAVLQLALDIDETVRRCRPDDWRGIQTRENVIKRELLPLLGNDMVEVERIFLIIRQQSEY